MLSKHVLIQAYVRTHAQRDGHPENIMPSAQSREWTEAKKDSILMINIIIIIILIILFAQ